MSTEALISQTTVTLNESQSHPNLYLNVNFSSLYHYIKFEKKSVNVQMQDNVTFLGPKSYK